MNSEVSATFQGFNQAADNNKAVILEQLSRHLVTGARVLEIGSGSGQHIAYFAEQQPQMIWQPTDRGDYFDILVPNIESLSAANVLPPRYLDIASFDLDDFFDGVYAANVIHIMPEALIPSLLEGAAGCLGPGGHLFIYGPFRYRGAFTTPSNARFDEWLKARDPASGIRDFEVLMGAALDAGFVLQSDTPMPANNQFLVFNRR